MMVCLIISGIKFLFENSSPDISDVCGLLNNEENSLTTERKDIKLSLSPLCVAGRGLACFSCQGMRTQPQRQQKGVF